MDMLEATNISADDPQVKDAAPDLLRALLAQQSAEDAHCNCPECDDGERAWWACGPCSDLYGAAIDLRHEALLKSGAMRCVPIPDADSTDTSGASDAQDLQGKE